MATNWTLYEKKLKINGDTERERHINTVVDSINNDFSHSPSYQEVEINGVTTGVHILEDSNKADNIKNIVMKPDDLLNIGNIIEWDNNKWICMSAELYSGAYYYGKIQKCIYTLTYNKNGISYEVPIVIESGVRLYSLGQDSTKYINTLSDEIIVYASATANIEVDDVYQIGKRNYKVRTVQDVLIDGLLVIKMEVTVEEPVIEKHDYNIEILNGDLINLLYTNQTIQLNTVCRDNGVTVDNPAITYQSSEPTVCNIDENGLVKAIGTGDVIITATFNNVSDTILIHVDISVIENYDIVLTPNDITLKLSRTLTLEAHAMNNGIEDFIKQFKWIITNADGTSNSYVTTAINDEICNITAINNANYINKIIIVRAELSHDSSVFTERQIRIVGLI